MKENIDTNSAEMTVRMLIKIMEEKGEIEFTKDFGDEVLGSYSTEILNSYNRCKSANNFNEYAEKCLLTYDSYYRFGDV